MAADAAGGVSAFISYSREDAEFVDRLEADLRARGFNVWVDRRRLEGGREWEQELERAISGHALTLVILSPRAVQSPYVRWEYETALRLGKRMIPVLYKVCPIPSALEKFQWIDFASASDDGHALKELIYACQDPSLDLTADSTALYNQALTLEGSDPERAAILLQRILDRNANYFGGQVAMDLQRLEQRLYAERVARLNAQAEQARQRGAYGVEAGALEAIIALGSADAAMYAWAQEYLPIAQQNRALLGPYEVIQQRVAAGDRASAAERLKVLWQQAPYFRDPSGIAPVLGLTVPPTYEEVKARRAADEVKRREEASAAAERTAAQQRATDKMQGQARQAEVEWQATHDMINRLADDLKGVTADDLVQRLKALAPLSDDTMEKRGHELVGSVRKYQRTEKAIASKKARIGSDRVLIRLASTAPYALVIIVLIAISLVLFAQIQPGPVLFGGIALTVAVVLIIFPVVSVYRLHRLENSERLAENQRDEIKSLYRDWLHEAEPVYEARKQQLETERRHAIEEAEVRYQQRMTAIAAEHQRKMDEITRQYAG